MSEDKTIGLRRFAATAAKDSGRVFWSLFRIAFPLIVLIEILDYYFGVVGYLGGALSPLMGIVGLPGEAGVVWATAMLLQIYAAILVLIPLASEMNLNAAQMTVLMTMILVAHALPVEARIVSQAGMRFWLSILIRLAAAFFLGWILHVVYADRWLQTPVVLPFITAEADSLGGWLANTVRNWAGIFCIIFILIVGINWLRQSRIEQLLIARFTPLFRPIGIGDKAITLMLIGMSLGISYGGGLLIDEGRRRTISRRDMLCTLTLLCLCHSIVEDTLLVMFIGAHWSGVFVGRVVFSVIFMLFFAYLVRRVNDTSLNIICSQPLSSRT